MLADPRHPVRFVNFVQCLLGSDILSLEGEKKYKTTYMSRKTKLSMRVHGLVKMEPLTTCLERSKNFFNHQYSIQTLHFEIFIFHLPFLDPFNLSYS